MKSIILIARINHKNNFKIKYPNVDTELIPLKHPTGLPKSTPAIIGVSQTVASFDRNRSSGTDL